MKYEDLLYFNEYGGFSEDGKEYKIRVKAEERTPLPWSHIMANEKYGTLVTSNGGGYTWHGNSRENKITTWSNDQVSDPQSESIYIKYNNNVYSALPNIIKNEFLITYGFGYAIYETSYEGIIQELTIFVHKELPEKIYILKLKNDTSETKKLKLYYCMEPVLGVSREHTKKHLIFSKNKNTIEIKNNYREHYSENTTYISSSEKIQKASCEKDDFDFEDGINDENFGVCRNPYVTIEIEANIASEAEKTICFSIGEKFRDEYRNVSEELEEVKNYWKDVVSTVQINTPIESMNIIMNGWLVYQTIVSRVYARTGFYQCGGAFGFRDQLQDLLGLLPIKPEIARKHILYHAEHQFKEGDVLHWWHPEKDNGIRSRYKDDLLWLPYVVCDYISVTGDKEILDEIVPYIEGRKLQDDEDELYEDTTKSDLKESIFLHCIKAIEISLNYGEHGLPQMGGGDWNDGMNKVCGESVWLGFFLYDVLKNFCKICEIKGDIEFKSKYENEMQKLKKALNENAWDGRWYRRAYFEDGTPLGSVQNDECKIDGISQSWSVISGAGENEKTIIAMDSLDNYLVDRENMIIKLLTPAFNESTIEPGYIKAYIPGVRENGGQYTHGAIWAIIANAILKNGNRAGEYFRIINPIEHARTKENATRYKVEPYVVAADVYSNSHLIGRGGWTWYTGSSSWLYVAGLKYILGFEKIGNKVKINPAIPEDWEKYEIYYKYKSSNYEIKVKNPNHNTTGIKSMYLDNNLQVTNEIELIDDGKSHVIDVEM